MAKVTGFTAQRMLEIEQASVVDAAIEGEDELIFYTRGGKRIRAGVIKGGTAEWIEEYKPIVDNSAEKVGDLLQSYNDMSELFVEVDQNLANLDQDLEDMHTRVETVSKDAMDALQNANAAAQTVSVEYAISQSHTVPPLSGWAKEQPAPQPGDVVWSRLVTTYGSGYVERSEPSPMTGWTGVDGVPGKDGFGVVDTVVSYVTTLSGTVTPSTGWTAAVPTLVQGRFLWTRTVWHYSDSSTETGYSVSYIAQDGSTGDDGLPGKDGVGIINTTITYASSDSGVNAPSSGWVAQPPAAIAGQFVWTRTVWEYSDNTTETGYSVGKIGNTGAKGDSGADGLPGKDGTTLVSTLIQYVLTTSGTIIPSTGWDTAIPTLTKGRYLWTKTTWTYSDKTPEVAHTVSYIAQDGSTGDDGLPGKDGVGHTGTTIEYAQSTSGTTAPTSGWAAQPPAPIAGRYIWTRTTWLYSDNTSEVGYSVGKIGDTGAKGDKGNTGTGVSSITPQYKSLPNLWGTPNPSENIAGYGGGYGIRTRTPLGLLVEVTDVPTASYSLVSTQSSYQVPVITNKKYTWRLPFKNVGSEPFPLTIYSWILGGTTRTFKQTLAPGESITVAFDDMTTPQTEGATIRYSIYYSDSETKPPIGAKILVADGATLVEGLTDDPWSNTEPPLQVGYSLFRREKIELDNGTVMYTPTSLVTANQSAERSLYISNLAKELAEGLVDLSPSMPENPLPGQVWISQDEKTNMTGVWRFNGSEWQQSSILTGLIMVPGEDGQMTLVGPKGIDAPSVLADIIRTEVLYANVGGVKKFIVSDIPRENLEDGVKTALDTAESIGTRIVLDGSKGELIIARDKYRSGVSDTMTVLTASSMNFMFDGKAVTSINSATQQLTTVNAQVQGALRFPSHTVKTLPGTSILVFQQA